MSVKISIHQLTDAMGAIRHRSSLVLIRDGRILLVRRQKPGKIYYIFPGGGLEGAETPEEAVVREAEEEAGITVEAVRVLHDVVTDIDHNTLVLCRQLGAAEPLWRERDKQEPDNSYAFEWVVVNALPATELLPLEGREAVIAYAKSI